MKILTEIGVFVIEKILELVNWFTNDGKISFTEGFSNMISGIGNVAKSVFNGVMGTIENFLNYAVNAINQLIRASNSVNPLFQIPTVQPIKIPRLAHGGMIGFAGTGVVE